MIVIWNDLKEYVISAKPHFMGGHQVVFRFPNNYGASVVRSHVSYGSRDGLLELAVLIFEGEDYKLTYDTIITNDVIGNLNPEECLAILHQIKELPKKCKMLED